MVGVVREMGHANNVKIVRVLALAPPPIIHRAIYYYVVLKGPRPIAAIEPLIISFPDKQSRTPELLPATAPSDPDDLQGGEEGAGFGCESEGLLYALPLLSEGREALRW